MMNRLRVVTSTASLKLKRLDPVKVSYLRTSFIFALAIFVTWTPSSINRLYSITNANKVSFELSVASGCVLPLQGVWNALIYFITSWSTIKEEMGTLKLKQSNREDRNQRATLRPEDGLYESPCRRTFEDDHEIDRLYASNTGHASDEVELCDRSNANSQA